MIDQAGSSYGTWDLAGASFTFGDETGTGWGLFVIGKVGSGYGGIAADFTPSGWTNDRIQNGQFGSNTADSIQLRLKSGPTNVHLIDYWGNNPNTNEDQYTDLNDSNNATSSLYLTGTGNCYADFSFANAAGNGTPGAVNVGQTLTAIPEPSAFMFGGLACGFLSIIAVGRKRMYHEG